MQLLEKIKSLYFSPRSVVESLNDSRQESLVIISGEVTGHQTGWRVAVRGGVRTEQIVLVNS